MAETSFALMEPFCVCAMVAVFCYYIFGIIPLMVCSITIITIGGNHSGIDCMFIDERKTKLYLFPVIQHQIPFTHSYHLYCTGSQSLLHIDNPLDVYKRDLEIEMPILFDFNENNYISVCYYNVINNKITNKNESFKAIISDNVPDTPIEIAYNTKTNVLLTIACTYTHIRNIIIYYLYTQQDGQQKEVLNKVIRAKAFHQPEAYNYAKTTAHLDIIDAVNAIINKENKILFSYCKFQIAMKSSLNGMARCGFALNCKSGIDLQDKRTNKTKLQFDFSSMIGGRGRNGSGYYGNIKAMHEPYNFAKDIVINLHLAIITRTLFCFKFFFVFFGCLFIDSIFCLNHCIIYIYPMNLLRAISTILKPFVTVNQSLFILLFFFSKAKV